MVEKENESPLTVFASDEKEAVPRYYVDAVNLFGGAYTFNLVCGVHPQRSSDPPIPTVIIQVSPQMASKLGELLTTMTRRFERESGMRLTPRAKRTTTENGGSEET